MVSLKKLLLVFIFLNGLISCSLSDEATVQYHPRFDFSSLSSYSFYERNSDFTDIQNISAVMRNNIEMGLEKAFDDKNIEYKTYGNSTIIISYYLVSYSQKNLKKYNKFVKYCQHCLDFLSGSKNKKTWRNTPGNLIVDVINAENGRSIWRSIYPLKLNAKESSTRAQERINDTIDLMFSHDLRDIQVEGRL